MFGQKYAVSQPISLVVVIGDESPISSSIIFASQLLLETCYNSYV